MQARALAYSAGMRTNDAGALVTALSEVARNVLVHGGGGEIRLGVIEESGRRAIAVAARDQGPGIADTEQAMRDGYSTAGSLGLGLSSAQRLVHEFELISTDGCGTTVLLKQWIAHQQRQ
jgi:serine/threonine-protein kinase RsbT